jgi:hypothetical protein
MPHLSAKHCQISIFKDKAGQSVFSRALEVTKFKYLQFFFTTLIVFVCFGLVLVFGLVWHYCSKKVFKKLGFKEMNITFAQFAILNVKHPDF